MKSLSYFNENDYLYVFIISKIDVIILHTVVWEIFVRKKFVVKNFRLRRP